MEHPPSPNGEAATRVRYFVLALFCVAAAVAYIQRYAINYLATPMQDGLALSDKEMGWVMASFFTAYAVFSIPSGWIGDRFGSWRTLAICAVGWSVATGLMATAQGFFGLILAWSLAGAAQAGLFPCALIALRRWLPATRRASASGMLSAFMNVGAVLSPLAAGALVHHHGYDWRGVFAVFAVPGLVWAAIFYVWFRDRPEDHRRVNAAELRLIRGGPDAVTPTSAGRRALLYLLAGNVRMWLICGQQFLRAAAQVFFGTWFGTYLRKLPGVSEEYVDDLASVPPAMLILGAVVGGVVSDWLLHRTGSRRISRQWLAVVNLLLCAAMFVAAAMVDDWRFAVALIALGCFWMTMGGVSSYTITMDIGGPYVATVFSTMNMAGSFGAAVFPLYVAWLLEATGDWDHVLLSIAAIYVIAAACWAVINPNGSLFDEAEEKA